MNSLTPIEQGLVKKTREAMTTLGIPDEESGKIYMAQTREFQEIVGITQEEILGVEIYPMINEGPQGERLHPPRVAIIGTCISRQVGFNEEARIINFVANCAHDSGKLKIQDLYPEKNPFTPDTEKYWNYMDNFKKKHLAPENIPTHWGLMLAATIESTHRHQRGTNHNSPYPKRLLFPRTKESDYLSKLTAIPDFLDAISTRPSKGTDRYATPEEVMTIAMKEYGELRINYNGKIFPKIDICGRELINELQKEGFVARERPSNLSEIDFRMNPFVGLEIK